MDSHGFKENGYKTWTVDLLADGWTGHVVTLMFAPIIGSPPEKVSRINELTQRFYSLLCVDSARHPSRQWKIIPRAWFWIGMPGASREETALRSLTRDTGLYVRGMVFTNPVSRLRCPLNDHINRYSNKYLKRCKLAWIAVQPAPSANCWNYVMSRLNSYQIDYPPVMIFPRAQSEMQRQEPIGPATRVRQDIQAATNLSDETVSRLVGEQTRARHPGRPDRIALGGRMKKRAFPKSART